MKIVGITGTAGAGKGTVTRYFVEKKEFAHFSASGFIVEEIKKRGLPIDRDSMTEVANDLRKSHGPSFIIAELLKYAQEQKKNTVIESIRAVGEAELLHDVGALLISVDAVQKKRYERIVQRGSPKDHVTYERFVEQENREVNSKDPTKQNIHAVMKMADICLTNNGTLDELEDQIQEKLETLLHQ